MSLEQDLDQSWQKYDDWSSDENDFSGRTATCKNNGDETTYKIEEKLGEGGFGVVYKAVDEEGNSIALKLLKYTSPKLINSAKRESIFLSEVNHPNIVKHKGFYSETNVEGIKGSFPAIAMEYINGETLNVAETDENFCNYVVQIMQGLKAAHDRGVLHRDIKPGNILITSDGQIKITDFGVSKFTREEAGADLSMTMTSERKDIAGTPKYLPRNNEELENPDERTDLFSLGLVFYKMLLSNVEASPDSKAPQRIKQAIKGKNKLPNSDKLADLVCDLTLDVRDERPKNIEAVQSLDVYKEMEDIAGIPVYWRKFCGRMLPFPDRLAYSAAYAYFDGLDKDKRIEGAARFVKHDINDYSNFLNKMSDFFVLQRGFEHTKKEYPKNKEDADLEVQAIRYCLKNDEFTSVVQHLKEWEERIKKYQSEFGLNGEEELGILSKTITEKREQLFAKFVKDIENKISNNSEATQFLVNTNFNDLTKDQTQKIQKLLYEKFNETKEKEITKEDVNDKYHSLVESLEGKKVTQEFKDAYAMAAYKDGIESENIDTLLATIEVWRHKSITDKIKQEYSNFKSTFTNERNHPHFAKHDARCLMNKLDKKDSAKDIDKILNQIQKLGRKHKAFIGNFIEKAILDYAERVLEDSTISLVEGISSIARLGHKYNVYVGPILDTALKKTVKKNTDFLEKMSIHVVQYLEPYTYQKGYNELQQKYPNAFKEPPKFEDLEEMVGGKKIKTHMNTLALTIGDEDFILPQALLKGGSIGAALSGGLTYCLTDWPIDYSYYFLPVGMGAIAGIFVYGCAKAVLTEIKYQNKQKKKNLEKSEKELVSETETQKQPEQPEKIIPKEDINELMKNSASISTTEITAYRPGETPVIENKPENVVDITETIEEPKPEPTPETEPIQTPTNPELAPEPVKEPEPSSVEVPAKEPIQPRTEPEPTVEIPIQTQPIQEDYQEDEEEDEGEVMKVYEE